MTASPLDAAALAELRAELVEAERFGRFAEVPRPMLAAILVEIEQLRGEHAVALEHKEARVNADKKAHEACEAARARNETIRELNERVQELNGLARESAAARDDALNTNRQSLAALDKALCRAEAAEREREDLRAQVKRWEDKEVRRASCCVAHERALKKIAGILASEAEPAAKLIELRAVSAGVTYDDDPRGGG